MFLFDRANRFLEETDEERKRREQEEFGAQVLQGAKPEEVAAQQEQQRPQGGNLFSRAAAFMEEVEAQRGQQGPQGDDLFSRAAAFLEQDRPKATPIREAPPPEELNEGMALLSGVPRDTVDEAQAAIEAGEMDQEQIRIANALARNRAQARYDERGVLGEFWGEAVANLRTDAPALSTALYRLSVSEDEEQMARALKELDSGLAGHVGNVASYVVPAALELLLTKGLAAVAAKATAGAVSPAMQMVNRGLTTASKFIGKGTSFREAATILGAEEVPFVAGDIVDQKSIEEIGEGMLFSLMMAGAFEGLAGAVRTARGHKATARFADELLDAVKPEDMAPTVKLTDGTTVTGKPGEGHINLAARLEEEGLALELAPGSEAFRLPDGSTMSYDDGNLARGMADVDPMELPPVERAPVPEPAPLKEPKPTVRQRVADAINPEGAEERRALRRQATIDEATGVQNKNALLRAEKAINDNPKRGFAYIDIGNLKGINEAYGEAGGDRVLAYIGAKLSEMFGEGVSFRKGGDEFVVAGAIDEVEDIANSAREILKGKTVREVMEEVGADGLDVVKPEYLDEASGLHVGHGATLDAANKMGKARGSMRGQPAPSQVKPDAPSQVEPAAASRPKEVSPEEPTRPTADVREPAPRAPVDVPEAPISAPEVGRISATLTKRQAELLGVPQKLDLDEDELFDLYDQAGNRLAELNEQGTSRAIRGERRALGNAQQQLREALEGAGVDLHQKRVARATAAQDAQGQVAGQYTMDGGAGGWYKIRNAEGEMVESVRGKAAAEAKLAEMNDALNAPQKAVEAPEVTRPTPVDEAQPPAPRETDVSPKTTEIDTTDSFLTEEGQRVWRPFGDDQAKRDRAADALKALAKGGDKEAKTALSWLKRSDLHQDAGLQKGTYDDVMATIAEKVPELDEAVEAPVRATEPKEVPGVVPRAEEPPAISRNIEETAPRGRTTAESGAKRPKAPSQPDAEPPISREEYLEAEQKLAERGANDVDAPRAVDEVEQGVPIRPDEPTVKLRVHQSVADALGIDRVESVTRETLEELRDAAEQAIIDAPVRQQGKWKKTIDRMDDMLEEFDDLAEVRRPTPKDLQREADEVVEREFAKVTDAELAKADPDAVRAELEKNRAFAERLADNPRAGYWNIGSWLKPDPDSVAGKVLSKFKRNLFSAGEVPVGIFRQFHRTNNAIKADLRRVTRVGVDLQRAMERRGWSVAEPPAAVLDDINAILTKKARPEDTALPPDVAALVHRQRKLVTSLSKTFRHLGITTGDLLATVDEKMDTWLTRTYRQFTDPKDWSPDESVRRRVHKWAMDNGADYERAWAIVNILESKGSTFSDMWGSMSKLGTKERGITRALSGYVPKHIRHQIKKLTGLDEADELVDAFIGRGVLEDGTRDTRIIDALREKKGGDKLIRKLEARLEIPEPIRQLWGEETNPLMNVAQSVYKASRLINSQKLMDTVLTDLTKTGDIVPAGHFTNAKAEGFIQLTPQMARDLTGAMPRKPEEALFINKHVYEALQDMFASRVKEDVGIVGKLFRGTTIGVKFGLTAGSLGTHSRNVVGSTYFPALHGHLGVWRPVKTAKTLFGGSKTEGSYARAFAAAKEGLRTKIFGSSEGFASYMDELTEIGVTDSSVRAAEFRDNMKEILNQGPEDLGDWFLKKEQDIISKFGRGTKKAFNLLTDLYRMEDDVAKVMFYENELAGLRWAEDARLAAGEVTEAELKLEAAELSRAFYPNYDLVPKWIQNLRVHPVFSAFPSFIAETWRTGKNHAVRTHYELGHPNPRMRAMGMRRLLGGVQVATVPTAIGAALALRAGVSHEEQRALERSAGKYQDNNTLWIWDRDEDGNYGVFDVSYTDPGSVWRAPLNVIKNDMFEGDFGIDSVYEAVGEGLEGFTSQEVLFKAAVDALRGQDEFGRAVRDQELGPWAQTWQAVTYIADEVKPGTIRSAEQVFEAAIGAWQSNQTQRSLIGEVGGVVPGIRYQKMNPRAKLNWGLGGIKGRITAAEDELDRIITDPNPISIGTLLDAYENLEKKRLGIMEEGIEKVDDARTLLVPEESIEKLVGFKQFLSDDRDGLLNGFYMPRAFGDTWKERVKEKLMEVAGGDPERAAQLEQQLDARIQHVRDLAADREQRREYR